MAPVGLFEADATGSLVFVNRTWTWLAGIPPEAAMGQGWTAALDPRDRRRVRDEWDVAIATGRAFHSEFRFRHPDGQVRWLEAAAEVRRAEDGRVLGWVGSLTDVSERRLQEEQLRTSRDRLLEAQRIGGMGNWEADLELRPTFWSPQVYRIWGRPQEHPPSFEEFLDAVVPEDRTELAAAYERLRADGEPFDLEYRIRCPDGELRHLHCVGTLAREPAGSPPRLAGTIQDITERREVEEALRERDAELRSFYQGSPLMMGIVELVGDDVLHVSENPATAGLFGAPNATDGGHRLVSEMGISPAQKALWVRRYQEAGSAGRPVRFEYRHQGPETPRWLSATICPIETPPGRRPRFAYVVEDATERKGAEELLAEQADELARSNRELEQFAYVASHDLQEPLRTVASYAELLSERYQGRLDADAEDFLGFIVDGAIRMRSLITDLLSYAKVSSRREPPAAVDTAEVLEAALVALQAAISAGGAEVTAGPLPRVQGIGRQLQQLFQNLIGNAIKFAGPNPPRITVSAEPAGSAWVFSVADNGIGIAPQHTERIFQIFQRLHTRAEYPGTGVGLALCRRIVEEHGGRIWVESAAGRGSIFRFTLPVQARGGR